MFRGLVSLGSANGVWVTGEDLRWVKDWSPSRVVP